MKIYRFLMGSGLLSIALLWSLSCSAASTSTPEPEPTPAAPTQEPTPTPSPREVMERASNRMMTLNTARFSLVHEGEGSVELFPGVELQQLEGQVDMPDRFRVSAEAMSTLFRSFIRIDVVVSGDRAFIRDFIDEDKWNPTPVESLPFDFTDLGSTLSDIIMDLQAPVFTGTEEVDGAPSQRVKGTVLSESLGVLVPGAHLGHQLELELWIGQSEGLLRKVRIEGPIVSTDSPDVVRILAIHSFGKPVEIALPQRE